MSTSSASSGTSAAADGQSRKQSQNQRRGTPAVSGTDRLTQVYHQLVRRTHPDWDLTRSPFEAAVMRQRAARIHHAHTALREPAFLASAASRLLDPDDPRFFNDFRVPNAAECMLCASTPAAEVMIYLPRTLPFIKSTPVVDGPLCRGCGLTMVATMGRRLPIVMWWNLGRLAHNKRLRTANEMARSALWELDTTGSVKDEVHPDVFGAQVVSFLAGPLPDSELQARTTRSDGWIVVALTVIGVVAFAVWLAVLN